MEEHLSQPQCNNASRIARGIAASTRFFFCSECFLRSYKTSRASKGSAVVVMVCPRPLLSLMRDQVFDKEVKALRRCVSGERPGDSFAEDVEGQATHVFVSPEAFMAFTIRFLGAIQIQLARLYKRPVPSADYPRLSLTLALGPHVTQLTQSFLNSTYKLKKRWLSRHVCVWNSTIFNYS